VSHYAAVALQLAARSVEHCADRAAVSEQVLAHIAEVAGKLRASAIFIEQFGGTPVRLAVLPEYLFTSYPGRIGIAEYAAKVAWDMDGPEYDALGRIAEAQALWLAGNAYERDPAFPGLYFQTSFVVSPDGAVVLRYRRLNSMYAPTPHDIWSAYLDRYGLDGVFPVARTEIGNLAAIASEEILYPEIARAHALRGAEVFVHSSSEIGSPMPTPKSIARRARAWENAAYVVSCNTAGVHGAGLPQDCADGQSAIIGYKGEVISLANPGETFVAFADLDLAALRTQRRKPGMTNSLARQRLELFAPVYASASPQRADSLIGADGAIAVPERGHFRRTMLQTIERLSTEGLI